MIRMARQRIGRMDNPRPPRPPIEQENIPPGWTLVATNDLLLALHGIDYIRVIPAKRGAS